MKRKNESKVSSLGGLDGLDRLYFVLKKKRKQRTMVKSQLDQAVLRR